jgi:hypothetical protein
MEDLITHYTDFKSFKKIVRKKYFIAFYNKEEILTEFAPKEKDIKTYPIPMVCFCDFDVEKNKHSEKYGNVGISFKKQWALNNGLNPVLYIHQETKIKKKLLDIYKKKDNEFRSAIHDNRTKVLNNHYDFLYISYFMKPYDGISNKTKKKEIFYEEREWRFIPQILKNKYLETDELCKINNIIKTDSDFHLNFKLEDIEYIFLKNRLLKSMFDFLNKNKFKELVKKLRVI